MKNALSFTPLFMILYPDKTRTGEEMENIMRQGHGCVHQMPRTAVMETLFLGKM